ncbi:MAG: hypothetical protein ACM35G_13525 [Planctomycetaceae bacterium]
MALLARDDDPERTFPGRERLAVPMVGQEDDAVVHAGPISGGAMTAR